MGREITLSRKIREGRNNIEGKTDQDIGQKENVHVQLKLVG